VLRFVGEAIRLRLREATASLPLENVQDVTSSEEVEPRQLAGRHQRRQRLALSLDDELVVAERYSIEQLSQAFPDLKRRHTLSDHRTQVYQHS